MSVHGDVGVHVCHEGVGREKDTKGVGGWVTARVTQRMAIEWEGGSGTEPVS